MGALHERLEGGSRSLRLLPLTKTGEPFYRQTSTSTSTTSRLPALDQYAWTIAVWHREIYP